MVIEEDFKNSDGFYYVKRNSFITLEEQEYDYSIDRIIIRSSLSSNLEISSRFFKQYIYIYFKQFKRNVVTFQSRFSLTILERTLHLASLWS